MKEQIIIQSVSPDTFEFQDYSSSDQTLITTNELDTVFSGSIDYIEAYVFDANKVSITSAVPFTNYKVTEGNVVLNPSEDLERFGFDVGEYFISYEFYRPRLGSTLNTTYYISEISSDRTEIRLDTTVIDNALVISSSLEFIEYRDTAEYFVDFFLNFGDNQQIIANNLELDTTDENNPTLLVKLYDPLPSEFDLKSVCSVVEEISTPQSYKVTFPPLEFTQDDFTYISGPNYSLNIKGQSGTPGMDFSYSTLISSDVTSSTNQIDSLLNKKEIEISVDYEDYNDFIYFSSAYTRLQNFYYKVGLIQSASAQLGSITSATTGSVVYSASQATLSNIVSDTIKNFDGYEYFLYFNSGSQYSYPKSNSEPPYILYPTGSTEALNWLGSTDASSAYYGGQAVSASNYDENNQDSLYYAIPEYLRSDPQNAKYELFVDMVGQHYDNIWLYTKNITTKFDADNRLNYGISKDMVADAIRDFGVKLYSNNFNTDDLYVAFLGLTPSGSSFPFPYITGSTPADTGYEYVNSQISASNDIIPLDDINKRLYKRIYHNIPYLLKTKGTVAGLRALITSYGIPDTILRINEFGGKDRNNSQDWDLKQDFYNVGLNTTSSAFTSSFVLNSAFSSSIIPPSSDPTPIVSRPGAMQFRFKTNGIPSASNSPTTQSFFETDSTSTVAMGIEYNEALLVTGSYSGSVESQYKNYGTIKFWPNIDTNPTNYASLYLPFWDGNWWSVQVNRNSENATFTLLAANKIGENLGFTGSDTISADLGPWNSSDSILWLPQTYKQFAGIYYFPLTGSLQEVRYYTEAISESIFHDYAMNPYSFEGNSTNSAPDKLAFRLSLGTLLNTGSYEDSIHPKITGSWITTSSFNGQSSASFSGTPTWLNNVEDIYLDQTPSGIRNRVTDKIQTEELILPEGDTLSAYRSVQQNSYSSGSFTPSVNYLEVAFSPQDQINDDITAQMGYFNLGDYIGDPRLISSSATSYPDLDLLRDAYFEKYITNYDLTDFIRLIKFFDNSLFKMIEDFTPARTSLSSGVVIKQHLLERNRQRPAIVTSSFEQFSGSVKNLPKDYSTGSSDQPQYATSGSAIYVFKGGTGGSFEPFNGLQTYPSGTLGIGPDNRYFLTQSWEESWMTFSGSAPIQRVDQREFYNGEFSGSIIPVGIEDICSAYFKPGMQEYRYVPVFWSADGNNSTLTISESEFLSPTNQPPTGYVWFWNNGDNIVYIKLSLESYNGINISTFIQNVEYVTFQFTAPVDSNGEFIVPNTPQTFYLESIVIQPGTSAVPPGVGDALAYTVPGISSTVVSSADASFYNFNFSASGDYQWHATQNTATDPNPVLDTGISASVPQGYFPLTADYPTESFFRGWASSNFYTNGTYNSYNGILYDPLDNFNTGSHERDNTDTTLLSGVDPASNFPWFMNAGVEGEGLSWIQVPSESFLDYANIPDSTVGPVATNNYFNIAWTSQSSAESPAIQGVNYYYNASNNAIYMSGSEYQNELKIINPLYSSSLMFKISGTSQLSSTATSYTPLGQTNLVIPIDPSRGQELWVYRGESFAPVADSNAWRYNRYIHRPYKVYYLTETGSGSPSDPYGEYDPMVRLPLAPNPLDRPTPYTTIWHGETVTMLGTQGDSIQRAYQKPLNATETLPSLEMVSGSFNVFSSLRQVKPFIFTTYKIVKPNPPVGGAIGSGSFVSISQSDGTPFARLQMFQYQNPNLILCQYQLYMVHQVGGGSTTINYFDGDGIQRSEQVNAGEFFAWCVDGLLVAPYPGGQYYQIDSTSGGGLLVGDFYDSPIWNSFSPPAESTFENCNQYCLSETDGSSGTLSVTSENTQPYFYYPPFKTLNAPTVGHQNGQYNIPYGGNFDGLNTSSLSLTTGTSPFGNNFQPQGLVFPPGSYIFTMSAFDTNQMEGGKTEFGLWTTYGDYAQYDLQHLDGSGVSSYTFNYTDQQGNSVNNTIGEDNEAYVFAQLGTPNVSGIFDPDYVVTSSISTRYASGVALPSSFATKVVDAYLVYSQSASGSLDGGYLFDVVPTLTNISFTASVVVSSFTDAQSALYGNAIYGTDEYGGGNSGGGTTWTTASIHLYSGSANNFPNKMPVIGDGNILASTSSYSLTHHEGERITLMADFPAGSFEYNEVLKLALKVESGSNASSVVQNSLVVTEYSMSFSSSYDPTIDPSIPTVFDSDNNFALAYDCQPLLNNYQDGRLNLRLQDIDYNDGILTPSNFQQIIEFSASRASVPESNYTAIRSRGPRYIGKQSTSAIINQWSAGDAGSYGKLPNVEIARAYTTYFNALSDPYPLLNNKVQYSLQYLIGQDGDISQPKLSNTSIYNIQGTFDEWGINRVVENPPYTSSGVVSLVNPDDNNLLPLQGEVPIYKIGQRLVPVIYTQQSGVFPFMIPGETAGVLTASIQLIGNEPVDVNIQPEFNNYTSTAIGESSQSGNQSTFGPVTFKANNVTPSSDGNSSATSPTRNVTASVTNTGTGLPVYQTSTGASHGFLTIPVTDGTAFAADTGITPGTGNDLSQPYDLNFSLGIDTTPLTYRVQTTNPNKSNNFNTNPNVGSLNVILDRKENYASGVFAGARLQNVKVTFTNYYSAIGGSNRQVTFDYGSAASQFVEVNAGSGTGGVTVRFNTDIIEEIITDVGESAKAVSDGGGLLKQRWTISAKLRQTGGGGFSAYPANPLKQGQQFRIEASGDFITGASQFNANLNPKFFPSAQDGSAFYKLELQGRSSNPIEDAIAPFWEFSGSSQSTLICVSPQLNKAYGRDFKQKDLIYTASQNKDFPGGLEPFYTSFPTVQENWSVQQGDQIRFKNDEEHAYTITNVTTPEANTDSNTWVDNFPSLIIEVDGDIPTSFDQRYTASLNILGRALNPLFSQSLFDTGPETVVPQYEDILVDGARIVRGLDFFVLRRFKDDAGVIIMDQQVPYNNPPNTGSSAGFIFPPYPTEPLSVEPDNLLEDLRNNKLIE